MNNDYVTHNSSHQTFFPSQGFTKAILGIAALPSAPTFDWCTKAASILTPLHTNAMVGVAIARYHHDRNRMSSESSGASSIPSTLPSSTEQLRSSLERLIGSPLGQNAHPTQAGLVAPISKVFPYSGSSKTKNLWTKPDPGQCLIALAALPDTYDLSTDTSLAVLIAIATNDPPPFQIPDPVALSMALAAITKKASIAIPPDRSEKIPWLTQREQTILEHLVKGESVREIAEQIDRSPHTVHDHVKNLHRKLDATCRGQLVSRILGHQVSGEPLDLINPKIDTELMNFLRTQQPALAQSYLQIDPASNHPPRPKAKPLSEHSIAS